MASIKVHGVPMSTATMRVLAALYEKDLQFELIPVDMRAGAHKQEPFLSLNVSKIPHEFFFLVFYFPFITKDWFDALFCFLFQPFGQIPALEDGDLTLFG